MKVLLRHSVDKLGRRGEIVDVRPGYARNFLLPQGLAGEASAGAIRAFEFERRRLEKEESARLASLQNVIEQLRKFELSIEMKANEEGHLYASVNEQVIGKGLGDAGFQLDVKQIKLEKPIKELGIYQVPIAFGTETRVEIKVWVVEPKTEAAAGEPTTAPAAAKEE